MVVTRVSEDHFIVGTKEEGSVEVIVRDNLAYVYSLENGGKVGSVLGLYPALEKMLLERGITEVHIHTEPTKEELEIYENKRLADIYLRRYGFEPLYIVRRKTLIENE